jgi:hypothetical protein
MFFQDITGQYFLLPEYQYYFGELVNMLGFLYDTVNQKWT